MGPVCTVHLLTVLSQREGLSGHPEDTCYVAALGEALSRSHVLTVAPSGRPPQRPFHLLLLTFACIGKRITSSHPMTQVLRSTIPIIHLLRYPGRGRQVGSSHQQGGSDTELPGR